MGKRPKMACGSEEAALAAELRVESIKYEVGGEVADVGFLLFAEERDEIVDGRVFG